MLLITYPPFDAIHYTPHSMTYYTHPLHATNYTHPGLRLYIKLDLTTPSRSPSPPCNNTNTPSLTLPLTLSPSHPLMLPPSPPCNNTNSSAKNILSIGASYTATANVNNIPETLLTVATYSGGDTPSISIPLIMHPLSQ